jgi:Leucyl aminopeptidase (aminopeptidase T)
MRDPRDEQYANLLVETCVDVQPGWQVVVAASPLARPLLDEVCRAMPAAARTRSCERWTAAA